MAEVNIGTAGEVSKVRLIDESGDPATPDEGYAAVYVKSGGLHVIDDQGAVTGPLTASAAAIYPQRAFVFYDPYNWDVKAGTPSITMVVNTSALYNGFYTGGAGATAANGDAYETSIVLKAGTYDMYVLGATASSRGIVDWTLDGGSIVTGQDWYSSTLTVNVVKTSTGLSVATTGRHLLRATVNGKNASSSDYIVPLAAVWLVAQTQTSE